jgi:hypothetical protein
MLRIRPAKSTRLAVWDENPDVKSFPDQSPREFIAHAVKKLKFSFLDIEPPILNLWVANSRLPPISG